MTPKTLTLRTGDGVATPGPLTITMYVENGSSSVFTVNTSTLGVASTLYSSSIAGTPISPGNYYVMVNSNGTTNVDLPFYQMSSVLNGTQGLSNVPNKPVLQGTYTIVGGIPPASIVTTAITSVLSGVNVSNTLVFRLDN